MEMETVAIFAANPKNNQVKTDDNHCDFSSGSITITSGAITYSPIKNPLSGTVLLPSALHSVVTVWVSFLA